MDLSIVIVNFNSGEYLAGCLESIERQSLEEIECLVVDSGSTLPQATYLEDARARGTRIIEMKENLGYAAGCNQGFRESTGRLLLFLNPDVLALENCIPLLIRHLEDHFDVGVVEPRTFLDRGRAFIIPTVPQLTRKALFLEGAARLSGERAQRASRCRVQRALPAWQATEPIEVDTLTGAFLAMRRDTMEQMNGFDEAFPLFCEDSDLFLRLRKAGKKNVLLPRAEAVHFGHRSVATVWTEAMAKHKESRRRYIGKHLGWTTLFLNGIWERMVALSNRYRPLKPATEITDLGTLSKAPVLRWDGSIRSYLLEIALEPFFHTSAAGLAAGNSHVFDPLTWDSLFPGDYYFRASDRTDLTLIHAWHLRKA